MVQHKQCVLCQVRVHRQLYAMLHLEHYVPPHWEYNVDNAPSYEKKWGIDLVWKWQTGVHTPRGILVKKIENT